MTARIVGVALAYTVSLPDWWVVAVAGAGAAAVLVVALAVKRIGEALVRAGHPWYIAVGIEGVGAIGLVGWIQSYISLRALALLAQEPEWEADAWPAVLDTFAIVMGVAALGARGDDEHDRHADRLAYVYSAAAIAANILNALQTAISAGQTGLPLVITLLVRGLAPLTMVLGFHWLMKRIRPRRADVVQRAVAVILQAEELPRAAVLALAERVVPGLPARPELEGGVVPVTAPAPLPSSSPRQLPEPLVAHVDDEPVARPPRPRNRKAAGDDPRKARVRAYWEKAVHDGTEAGLTASDLIREAGGRPPLADRTARRWLSVWRKNRVTLLEGRKEATQ